MFANGWVEQLLFYSGVDAQLFDGLFSDLLFLGFAFRGLELLEEGLHAVVISLEHPDSVVLFAGEPVKHFAAQLAYQPIGHVRRPLMRPRRSSWLLPG